MLRYGLLALAAIAALAAWAVLVFAAAFSGWGRTAIAPVGDAEAFVQAVVDEVEGVHPGNFAFALVEDGQLVGEYYTSPGEPIDRHTSFQTASLSKWVSAVGIMALVEDGRIDLDAPVSTYLQSWQLPESGFDNEQVTVRLLLSHTAGLTDGLGYGGFRPGTTVQSLPDALSQASDASPGADGRVRVGMTPGEQFEYSGGGYSLLQLIVEDVTGESFETYMQGAVFQPLAMHDSSYLDPEDGGVNRAEIYDAAGEPAVRYRFSGLAPTALNASTADMVAFVLFHLSSNSGNEASSTPVLQPDTIELMRQPHAFQMGAEIWGLGTVLYAPDGVGDFIAGHDGSNEPAINSAVRYNPATRDAIVILETGDAMLATRLAGEWVFWQNGQLDSFSFMTALDSMLERVVIGWLVIGLATVILLIVMIRRGRRRA
ncbi:serine hydrolase domain-containing protein [Maricaulis sp.]|uniref:serine hydrolase domain-containing protein n=1 Tax=Maricaulis sp. TaxID=1486257 RepID=UPI003A91234D